MSDLPKEEYKAAYEHGKSVATYTMSSLPERYAPLTFDSWYEVLMEEKQQANDDKTESEKVLPLPVVSVSLPNEIDLGALANLLKYSDKYEISIQFWPEQIAVYIEKDGVDLKDFGGGFDFAVSNSIAYLDRITGQ